MEGAESTQTADQTMSGLEEKWKRGFWFRKWDSIDITNLCVVIVKHVLAFCAPFVFDWGALCVTLVVGFMTSVGVTLGYHRLLTHRSFKIPKWLEYFIVYCGAHSGQRDPIFWVSIHKNHHKYVDTEKDPHSPMEGFWFSFMGWFFYNDYIATKLAFSYASAALYRGRFKREWYLFVRITGMVIYHIRCYTKSPKNPYDFPYHLTGPKGLPNHSGESRSGEYSNVPELKAHWFYRFLHDTCIWHEVALAVLLYLHGGFPYLAWGMGMREWLVNYITLLVTSVSHIWGQRSWNTSDTSTNNWWVAMLTLGEGWHNNHHAFPKSARHGLEWWQFDLTWELIKFLQMVGLATDVKVATEADKKRMAYSSLAIVR